MNAEGLELEFNAIAGQLSHGIRDDWMDSLRRLQGQVLEIVRGFEREAARLASNAELSDIGRTARRSQLAAAAADRLQRVSAEAAGILKRVEGLRKQTVAAPREPNEVVRALRYYEIRARIDSQEQLTLQANVLSWAGSVDTHELCEAVLDSPVRLVDAETEARVRELMAAVVSPEVGRQIRELQVIHRAIESGIRSAMGVLKANGLVDDPLRDLAKTGQVPTRK